MRYSIIGVLGLCVLSSALSAEVPECTLKHSTVMVVGSQSEFSVRLPSNPTTGYRWFLQEIDPELRPVKMTFVSLNSPKRVGAGGEELWMFKANQTNVPLVKVAHFVYARPFEKKPAQSFDCQVYVFPKSV